VVAENQQVQQLLGAHSSELKQSLSEQGFSLEKFEVMTQGQNAQTNSDLAQDGRAIESKARQFGFDPGQEAGSEDQTPIHFWTAPRGRVDLLA